MNNKVEQRGDWSIQRRGRSAWYAENTKAEIYFSVEYKKNLEKTLKKVNTELEKDPTAVPPPCHRTPDRRDRKAQKVWDQNSPEEKMAQVDQTVVSHLQHLVSWGTQVEQAVDTAASPFDYVQHKLNQREIVYVLALKYFETALNQDSPQQRLEYIKKEESKIRKVILQFGYEPSVTDAWSRAWQHMHYQTLVKVRTEFDAILHLYEKAS